MGYIGGMFINNIDPVAFAFGPVEIRWYSLFFAIGICSFYVLAGALWKKRGWAMSDFDTLILYLFIGMVVGARLGEVFFYKWDYYSSGAGAAAAGFWPAFAEVFKVWKGGLSSHGATIGVLIAYTAFWWTRKKIAEKSGVKSFKFMERIDLTALCMPLVAGFVRLGNFFNSEIVGRAVGENSVVGNALGVVFAQNGESFARYPVQLYEGLLAWGTFALVFVLYLRDLKASDYVDRGAVREGSCGAKQRPAGFFLFLFIGVYFSGRFLLEFLKEYQVVDGVTDGLPFGITMGQALSVVPILIAGGWFVFNRSRSLPGKDR